jgi:hypothetical protein
VRLTVPAGAPTTTIDLMDSQLVGPPKVDVIAANVLLFGADPSGRRDSANAFDKAIAFAQRSHLKVYVPPGTYQVNRHIIVYNVTCRRCRQLVHDHQGSPGRSEHARGRRICAHRRSASTARTRRSAAAAMFTFPVLPSRVTCANESISTRSTESVGR